jgi:hypothetical protein
MAFVMLRWRDGEKVEPESVTPFAVYETLEEVEARIARIDAHRDNTEYDMERVGKGMNWRMGPDHDVGFFGQAAMCFRAVEVPAPKR